MALDPNPTRTKRIEKAWFREINRRWRLFAKETTEELARMADPPTALTFNVFEQNPAQLTAYIEFYKQKIDEILLGTTEPPNWQARYQLESYQRGLARTRASLKSQGVVLGVTPQGVAPVAISAQGLGAIPSLSFEVSVIQAFPVHQSAVEFLTTRSYESLKGWTDAQAREARQILTDGLRQGEGIREITRKLRARAGVSKASAQRIARTETIQAFQRSAIEETQRVSEQTGEELLQRWVTARDSRVRHLHAGWHGDVITPDEGFDRIGLSPWNCRCALLPVVPELITEAKTEKFTKEREQLLNLEKSG